MKTPRVRQTQKWASMLCLLLSLQCAAAQFVELTSEIEINDWDYWFFTDRLRNRPEEAHSPGISLKSQTRRCVVGTNTWMIESETANSKVTRWFTGTNVVWRRTTSPSSSIRFTVNERAGLEFPLEFYGVQYLPSGTNGWKLHLTLKGKVNVIGVGIEPRIPAEVEKAMK